MEDKMKEDMIPVDPEYTKPQQYPYSSSGVAPAKEKVDKKLSPKQKKKLVILQTEMNLMVIKFAGCGQVPDQLKGNWNNRMLAQRQIDIYLAERK